MRSAIPGRFAVRIAVLWVVVRVALAALLLASGGLVPGLQAAARPPVIRIAPPAALAVAVLVTVLVLLDVRAMRERVFLANLGVGLGTVAMAAFGGAVLFELIVYSAFALT